MSEKKKKKRRPLYTLQSPKNTNLIKSGDEINGRIISGRQLIAAVKLQIKKKI